MALTSGFGMRALVSVTVQIIVRKKVIFSHRITVIILSSYLDASRRYLESFFLNNQPDALIVQIYSVIKLYMFRASSLPIISIFILYIRHW
jgi:hypothetical protein